MWVRCDRLHVLKLNTGDLKNKLAKARKTRKSPGTLDLKRFGPGKLWVKNFRKAYPNPNLKKNRVPFLQLFT